MNKVFIKIFFLVFFVSCGKENASVNIKDKSNKPEEEQNIFGFNSKNEAIYKCIDDHYLKLSIGEDSNQITIQGLPFRFKKFALGSLTKLNFERNEDGTLKALEKIFQGGRIYSNPTIVSKGKLKFWNTSAEEVPAHLTGDGNGGIFNSSSFETTCDLVTFNRESRKQLLRVT